MDVLQQFGELSEDIYEKRKYAKWRAAYIHNCLKNGEIPISGNAKIIYTKEEEENFKDFMSKEEYERLKEEREKNEPSSSGATPPATTPPATTPSPPVANSPAPKPELPPAWPEPTPMNIPNASPPQSSISLNADQMEKAQKYCKWASSALTYEDVATAINNLQKALNLLKFGKDDM